MSLLEKLHACEAILARGLSGDPSLDGFEPKLREFRSSCKGEDAPFVVVADELQALAHICAPSLFERVPAPRSENADRRFGYGVVSTAAGEVLSPALAILLQGRDSPRKIAGDIPGLRIADHALWTDLLSDGAPLTPSRARVLAARWLGSPARKLAVDLSVLDVEDFAGEKESSLLDAVGPVDDLSSSVDDDIWPPPHACVPMHSFDVSIGEGDDVSVVRALRSLAAPQWIWSRSQAVGALLRRAARIAVYRVGSLDIDLRDELPARLGAVLQVPDDESLVELESEVLRIALLLVPTRPDAASVFAVARWLGYLITRSPFLSNDSRILAARLATVRQGAPPRKPNATDELLHPARIRAMLGRSVQSWREFSIVIGAANHYLADDGVFLDPVPAPLLEFLRGVAARQLSDEERHAEEASARVSSTTSALERHLATPWIARAVLHQARSSWLSQLDTNAFAEALSSLEVDPRRYGWLTESIALAGKFLKHPQRVEVANWWAHTSPSRGLQARHLTLAASAAIAEIAERKLLGRVDEQLRLIDEISWRVGVAHTLTTAARHAGEPTLERHFLKTLVDVAMNSALRDDDRQRALAWWVQHLQSEPKLKTDDDMAQLREIARTRLVTSNVSLRTLLADIGIRGKS